MPLFHCCLSHNWTALTYQTHHENDDVCPGIWSAVAFSVVYTPNILVGKAQRNTSIELQSFTGLGYENPEVTGGLPDGLVRQFWMSDFSMCGHFFSCCVVRWQATSGGLVPTRDHWAGGRHRNPYLRERWVAAERSMRHIYLQSRKKKQTDLEVHRQVPDICHIQYQKYYWYGDFNDNTQLWLDLS